MESPAYGQAAVQPKCRKLAAATAVQYRTAPKFGATDKMRPSPCRENAFPRRFAEPVNTLFRQPWN
ncbi:hypothetical protein MACH18_33160 [Phaeobacter italicus]|nr:hypothetical protein MACH18_33160 [Phaeobacter italicus]